MALPHSTLSPARHWRPASPVRASRAAGIRRGRARVRTPVGMQAALAAKWKEPPRDALDTMVLKTGLKLPQARAHTLSQ